MGLESTDSTGAPRNRCAEAGHSAQRRTATSRCGIIVAMLFVLGTFASVVIDSSPAHAESAEVFSAPGCPGAHPDFPLIDLCEDNGYYELSSTGTLSGGANITMSTSVPPCNSQDTITDIFEPDGCYSAVEFEIDPFNCTGINVYDPDNPDFGPCGFYADDRNSGFYSGLQGQACRSEFDRLFVNGGNAADPGSLWSTRGPASLSACVFTQTGDRFDGLYGPSWMEVDSLLRIEYSDGTTDFIRDVGWVSMDGEIRDIAPVAAFDRAEGVQPGRYNFVDESRSQFNDPLVSHEWEFQKLETGVDSDWVTVGTATGRVPSFVFPDADFALAKLTVTDQNGLEDSHTDAWELYLDSWTGPDSDGPFVIVEATDSDAGEQGPNTGTWTVTRSDTIGELTVNLSKSGTATEGVDYVAIDDEITFPNSVDEILVTLTPISDGVVEGDEVVTLTIEQGIGYAPGDPDTADITIADYNPNPPPTGPGTPPPAERRNRLQTLINQLLLD